MSQNTNKPLTVSNCHRAAIVETNGLLYCATCHQRCSEVELLVERAVTEDDDTKDLL